MADLYEEPKAFPASPSSSSGLALDRDDFSVFFHNLLRSSSSLAQASSMYYKAKHPSLSFASSSPPPPPLPPLISSPIQARSAGGVAVVVPPEDLRRLSGSADVSYSECHDHTGYSLSFTCAVESDLIASSPNRRRFPTDTDLDGFGCDSEGPEAIDVPLKPGPPQRSSKRSRAADVHNLSEKRRRTRINDKLKSLQMLIPNSNKTDKASMLDEAIEYLKQLQLQVQMLSMRNGSSLHSVYRHGVMQPVQLPQAGMGFEEANGMPTANQGMLMQPGLDIPNQCSPPNQPIAVPTVTYVSNSSSFGSKPSIPTHDGSFNPSTSSQEFCRDDTSPLLQFDMGMTGKNPS